MTKRKSNHDDGLHQIETKRQRREPLDPSKSEAAKSRDAKGWTPQSEPTGVTEVESPA
jgi:hypothetical protein